jgi:hypothetical protein
MLRRVFLCCLLLPFCALAQNGAVSEYSLKAVLLLRLPQFIYWPQSDKPPSTINLCVQGSNPFGGLLQQVARSPGVATEIRFLDSGATYAGCDLLFVSRSESTQVDSLLQRTEGRRLVTVSDIPGFVRAGGMVELVVAGDKIGLTLNRRGAQRRGFDFNAQLLNLAQRVE